MVKQLLYSAGESDLSFGAIFANITGEDNMRFLHDRSSRQRIVG